LSKPWTVGSRPRAVGVSPLSAALVEEKRGQTLSVFATAAAQAATAAASVLINELDAGGLQS